MNLEKAVTTAKGAKGAKARRVAPEVVLLRLTFGLAVLAILPLRAAEPVLIYHTGFEFAEGYRYGYTLIGQNGWIGSGSGGNGVVTNYFTDAGHQAYIGAFPPAGEEEFSNVWRPVDLAPINPSLPLLTFSVRMQIEE